VKLVIDRRFFREPYNAQRIILEMDEAISEISNTQPLLEFVTEKISNALHPENVTIFLERENPNAYVAAFSSDGTRTGIAQGPRLSRLVLPVQARVISKLNRSKSFEFVQGQPAESDEESRTLQDVRASLLIPIAFNGNLHGLISLGQRLSGLQYTKEDIRLLLGVAKQVATFIENMETIRRIRDEERNARQLEMAAEVQRHLFPADGLENNAVEIFGVSVPALGVGGDYYDYFEIDDRRVGIAIADVAGKGIAAALLMSTVQASLRCQLISKERPLTAVVTAMNELLRRSTGDSGYATFFLAQFETETNRLTYVNAGHNPPMLIRAPANNGANNGRSNRLMIPRVFPNGAAISLPVSMLENPVVSQLPTGGPIIGTFLSGSYEQETIQLRSGDTVLIFTDGVTEALNSAGFEFGEERLRALLIENYRSSPGEAARKILARVFEWQGQGPQHDDITLIVVKVK
jgi:sigma-B regulation protein RsbU (phosphoserine phosphatase)